MKQRKLTMNIGIISFIVIFVILCLMTFAILSLSSAKSNAQSVETVLIIPNNIIFFQVKAKKH